MKGILQYIAKKSFFFRILKLLQDSPYNDSLDDNEMPNTDILKSDFIVTDFVEHVKIEEPDDMRKSKSMQKDEEFFDRINNSKDFFANKKLRISKK